MKLPPGHLLRYSLTNRQTDIIEYWKPDLTPAPFDPGRNYAQEFERQFLSAVESHIIASDAPVGAFLSGGLDSGSICAAAIELGHRKFHTFSIGGEVSGRDDELDLAQKVSKQLGTEHHQIVMTRQMYFDQLDTVAWHFDEPYGDDTAGAVLLLSRLAHQHVKVALSGEGADELLLGYTPERGLANLARIERRYRHWPPFLLKGMSHLFRGRRRSVLSAIAAEGPWAYSKGAATAAWWFADEDKKPIWRGGPVRRTHDLVASWFTLPVTVHPQAQSQQAMFQSWLVENQLMKSDKMGMATSLEIRAPFLHQPLVEWCQSSPLEARLGRSFREGSVQSKAVLREFAASRLPPEILQAPKRGFPLPVFGWLSQKLRDDGGFVPVSRAIPEWIDLRALERVVAQAAAGKRAETMKLFDVMMLDRWFKKYVD
jgi:asparagine synthase (glutamine-hydrolysing)